MLVKLINDILLGFDNKFASVLLLLDLSAAFDTVNISILLNILQSQIGIRGIAYDWFSSFLCERTMSVKVNDSYSEVHELKSGVAQGSVLGPVLFNVYICSFYKFIEREGFEIKGFADDHEIYASFAPTYQYQFLVTKLNCIFASVDLWMSRFFLKLNPLKSQIIVFCNDALKRQLNINGFFLGNSCIRFCDTVRNLGFTLDSLLTLEQQVKECVSSVFASIKSIARIKHLLTRNEVTILVSSLILSKLDYFNSLYYDISCSLTKQLQYAQNCAARLIYNKRKYDHVTELLIELHWLPIKYRILYKIYLLTYKCIYPTSFAQPEELKSLLSVDSKSTRFIRLKVQRNNFRISDRAFSIYAPKLWNQLSTALKNELNISRFKGDLKLTYFVKHSIYRYKFVLILSLIYSNLAAHSNLLFFDLGFVIFVFCNNCTHLLLLLVSMLHGLCVVVYITYETTSERKTCFHQV